MLLLDVVLVRLTKILSILVFEMLMNKAENASMQCALAWTIDLENNVELLGLLRILLIVVLLLQSL